jgi:hypothetical protein
MGLDSLGLDYQPRLLFTRNQVLQRPVAVVRTLFVCLFV